MSCYKSLFFSLLTISLFFSFSHGDSDFLTFQSPPTSGKVFEAEYGVVSWGTKRFLAEGPNGEGPLNSSLILAAKRTHRRDPLNGFKKYSGGWNIREPHYWASVALTAAPFFVIAAIWFVVFGLREPYGYSRTAYALSLIFLVLFTVAAIVGCVVLYTGQGKFHDITTKTLDYVVKQANTTVEKLTNVSGYLSAAKQVGVDQVFLPSNVQTDIDQIETKINSSASTLAARTTKNSGDIKQLLDSVVAEDTCVSMDQWVQNPTAHTALDDILPCIDNATAQETLLKSKEVTSQLVNVINQVITNVSNGNFSPNFAPLYYNQSGPLLSTLCNPFNSDLTDRACAAGEVDLSNATQVWRNYICQVSASGICITTGRLTPSIYNQMTAGVNVSYGLYHYGPFLVELQDCTFVRQTFTDINRDYCPGLEQYSTWIYIGLVMVSGAVMLSLVFWVIYGRERRHRVYTKQHLVFEGDKHT
ncbi:hypothetical protein HYC85_022614 [Camellia sinensis]|uniref:Uncharacterized protein n=1 Tax=Camellia sinensis TaxID=4442 RepID=A0A7J7GDG4_CAMSI|nr:hypothetical protein HYC85_022614 [Camellia sinensis]